MLQIHDITSNCGETKDETRDQILASPRSNDTPEFLFQQGDHISKQQQVKQQQPERYRHEGNTKLTQSPYQNSKARTPAISGTKRIQRSRPRTPTRHHNSSKTSRATMSPSMQGDFARRLLKRRRSLGNICLDSCSAAQQFFSAKEVDIFNETSDMEKPCRERPLSLPIDEEGQQLLSLSELAGVVSMQLSKAIDRGLFSSLTQNPRLSSS